MLSESLTIRPPQVKFLNNSPSQSRGQGPVSEDLPLPLYEVGSNKFDDLLDEYRVCAEAASALGDPCAFLAHFFSNLPIVAYIKAVQADGTLRMMWVNKAYERDIGVTTAEYNAMLDSDVWDHPTAQIFKDNDARVMKSGRAVPVAEPVLSRTTGRRQVWNGWKWPVVNNSGKIIAICGYAIPTEEDEGGNG